MSMSPPSSCAPAAAAAAALPQPPQSSSRRPRPRCTVLISAGRFSLPAAMTASVSSAPSTTPPLVEEDVLSGDKRGYGRNLFIAAVEADFFCPLCSAVCRDAVNSACCQRLACRRCVDVVWGQSETQLSSLQRVSQQGEQLHRGHLCRPPHPHAQHPLSAGLRGGRPAHRRPREGVAGASVPALPASPRPCVNSCGEHHRLCDGDRHLLTGCSNVPVPCQYGCGQLIRPSDAFANEQSCGSHRVPCPLGCFETAAQQAALSLPASARQYYATADPGSLSFHVLPGSRLDVLDRRNRWAVASVMRAEEEGKLLLVTYEAAPGVRSEVIRLTEGRECLAPLHRHTAPCCPAPAPADRQSASSAAASSDSCSQSLVSCARSFSTAPSASICSSSVPIALPSDQPGAPSTARTEFAVTTDGPSPQHAERRSTRRGGK